MAEDWDLSDFDDEDEGQKATKPNANDPKSLRAYVRKVAAENAEMKKALEEVAASTRRGNIVAKLAEKKLPDKIASLVPKDLENDKVDAWLDEYKDLWRVPEPDPGEGQPEVEDQEEVAERQALSRMAAATASTVPATRPNDMMARITDRTTTRDQLMKMIEEAGGGYGTG